MGVIDVDVLLFAALERTVDPGRPAPRDPGRRTRGVGEAAMTHTEAAKVVKRVAWMYVDRHTHRIAQSPDGVWAMYCPARGPDSLLYCEGWVWVLVALGLGTPCPHDDLLTASREDLEDSRRNLLTS